MPRIPEETLQQVLAATDIVDLIGRGVKLRRAGTNWLGLCPFHNEKSPSFTVSPSKEIYKCFGCGKAGDSVRFVMDMEGLGYGEALRHLAKKYGIDIQEEEMTDDQLVRQNERESLLIILEYAKEYFKKQ